MKKNIALSNVLYPQPIALVTCCDEEGNDNIITVAWTSNVSRTPPVVMISIGGEKYSYRLISRTKEFGLNLPGTGTLKEADFCGENSGEEINKFETTKFTKMDSVLIKPKLIKECPLNYECKVIEIQKIGGANLVFGEVVNSFADENIFTATQEISVEKLDIFTYINKGYYSLGRLLGKRGFSNQK